MAESGNTLYLLISIHAVLTVLKITMITHFLTWSDWSAWLEVDHMELSKCNSKTRKEEQH